MSERPRTMTAERKRELRVDWDPTLGNQIFETQRWREGGTLDDAQAVKELRSQIARLNEHIQSLRDWKSPDGVLQVKDLEWFKGIK